MEPRFRGPHRETLEEEIGHILEEARMLLPGIQALFGFQLIAVFSPSFSDRLARSHQLLHLVAILLVAIAAAIVISPAAYHRQAEPGEISERFVRLATRLLTAALVPLSLGICLDVYLVACVILGGALPSLAVGVALGLCFFTLWFAYPHAVRRSKALARRAPRA